MKLVKDFICGLLWKFKYSIDFNLRCRYAQTIRVLMDSNADKNNFKEILEIGSGDAGIGFLLPRYKNIAIDYSFGWDYLKLNNKKKVIASITALPFKSETFNFAISVDTLEHVSVDLRSNAVNEILRVSKKYVVITVPCSKLAEEYENKLSKYYSLKNIPIPQWLVEHRKYGLPSVDYILNLIDTACKNKKRIDNLPSGGLGAWYTVNCSIARGIYIYTMTNVIYSIAFLVTNKLINQIPSYRRTFIVEKSSLV